ncbi:unnamed protein product, partial [Mesorhabditis spiculigera]
MSSDKVYVGGLPNDATTQEVEDAFYRYGRIRKVWVARRPPGFAFVEFEDPRDAEDAVKGLDGARICGVSQPFTLAPSLTQPYSLAQPQPFAAPEARRIRRTRGAQEPFSLGLTLAFALKELDEDEDTTTSKPRPATPVDPHTLLLNHQVSFVWCSTLFFCLIASRTKGFPAIVGLNVVAGLITITLISWPLKSEAEESPTYIPDKEPDQVDPLFFPAVGLVILLSISIVYAIYRSLLLLITPTYAEPVLDRHRTDGVYR